LLPSKWSAWVGDGVLNGWSGPAGMQTPNRPAQCQTIEAVDRGSIAIGSVCAVEVKLPRKDAKQYAGILAVMQI
jgi:hypothetical protein